MCCSCSWSVTADQVTAAASVAYCLLTVGIFLYAKRQFDEARRTRQLQLLEEFSRRWSSALLLSARRLANSHASTQESFTQYFEEQERMDTAESYRLIELANFFEDLALRTEDGSINVSDLWNAMEPTLRHYHGLFSKLIEKRKPEEFLSSLDALCRKCAKPTS